MADIIMPKMGDAMEEGRIVRWLKNVGDPVAADEPILEIETDKSNVEVPAETAGTLQSVVFQAGDTVPVGTVIAVVGAGAQAPAVPKTEGGSPPAPNRSNGSSPPDAEMPALADAVPAPEAAPAPPKTTPAFQPVAPGPSAPVFATASMASAPFRPYDSFVGALPSNLGGSSSLVGEPLPGGGAPAGNNNGAERVKATPVARAMAQTHSLDLGAMRGSGSGGEIVKRDVEAALAGGALAPATTPQPAPAAVASSAGVKLAEGDEVQEYGAMRRTIAKRLAESKATIPHFYVTSEIDMEAMLRFREEVNTQAGADTAKISLNDFLVKAVAVALQAHPVANAVFSDNKRILRKTVNVGIAVSIEDGLIVPVVRDCGTKSLRAIARETHPLIEKARDNKLKPEEYTGGTFTISNLGQFDVENFAAIINPGEGAILAVASIRPVPAVVEGQIVPRKRMKVTLCADHRVMDGVQGAQFLQTLKRVLENPLNILL